MISLKKYLDMQSQASPPETPPAAPEPIEILPPADPFPVTIECYRSTLLAVGKSAVLGCPALGVELDKSLQTLEKLLAENSGSESVKQIESQVETLLQQWGERTAEHFKTKADEVKELLIALARTAESVGDRDHRYSSKFADLTVHLQEIGDLDNLTLIRSSLVRRVTDLKESVDQMTKDSLQLVAQLQAQVSTYETRLREAEHLVLKDELTGAASRRSAEESIQWNIANRQTFCILMLDLNGFKQINDRHGHSAGDQLLRQFASRLQLNTRSGDLVSRWGGDEFVVLLACDTNGAKTHVGRIYKSVFGKYLIQDGSDKDVCIQMDASVGLAQWRPGQTMQQLVAQADAVMYQDKRRSRGLDVRYHPR